MSDAPETIWATTSEQGTGSWNAEKSRMQAHMPPNWQTEYRLASLPVTNAQAFANEKVKALVEALERIAHVSDVYGVEANAEDQGAGTLAYAHKSTCNLARAALAAMEKNDD